MERISDEDGYHTVVDDDEGNTVIVYMSEHAQPWLVSLAARRAKQSAMMRLSGVDDEG